jgi:threonine synthase
MRDLCCLWEKAAHYLKKNPSLAESLELENIYLKREDLNPTGSHKDRGLAFEISSHIQDGKDEFIISSSGNAAISAVTLLKNTKNILHIFIPKFTVNK